MKVRVALSAPLVGLQWVTIGVTWVMYAVAMVLSRACTGGKTHVYWVLEQAKRWVRGTPMWRGEDLIRWGVQPQTKHQRELADKDMRFVRLDCQCGNPKCKNRDGRYVMVPSTLTAAEREQIREQFWKGR